METQKKKSITKKTFLDLKELISFLEIDAKNLKKILIKPSTHPIKIPYRLAQKMQKNDLTDPLFLQFVPLKKETNSQLKKSFKKDPLCDSSFLKGSLLHKYENRALILCSNNCAMHCRFCFRQHLQYESTAFKDFAIELKQIQKNKNLNEIILSGGDPLFLSNQALKKLLFSLDKIKHVKRIRIHSRFLIGCPQRLDKELLSIFSDFKKPLYFILHINHPQELTDDDSDNGDELLKALKKLQKCGVILMNQAVLLKGVNDNLETLLELSEKLSNNGILFYYLHQLDQVQGAEHFEVKKAKGLELIQKLLTKTSGYAVPKYVQEIPFKKSKTLLTCS